MAATKFDLRCSDETEAASFDNTQQLSKEKEALIVAFRKHTALPLDDCLYALQQRFRT